MDYLFEVISNFQKGMNQNSQALYSKYDSFRILLAFSSFAVLDPQDQEDLLKTRILSAIQNDFNPGDISKQFFIFFESENFIRDSFKLFAKNLEQNIEKLGDNTLEIEGKKYLPQLKNWILDYIKYPTQ